MTYLKIGGTVVMVKERNQYSEAERTINKNFRGRITVTKRNDGIIVKLGVKKFFVDLNGEMKIIF